ncbi:hypothetical protein [Desulfatitalea alkaliphila]|uniref:Uncharacterized protein n=1 Tax=Desulfatitalea alkaliphila TaxID=2929485 RepID=A0AA41R6R0_9BACT|nr:hypothetical protein [Desulfatitalea alkaliphila]MCJ8502235.1 hypothetical protein [Desulfatitalea alkaliphila]
MRRATVVAEPFPPAPCRGARRLLTAALVVVLMALLIITGATLRRSQQTQKWPAAFSLVTPALWPAGTPRRHPETVHPGVDLRWCAGLESTP